MIALPIMHFRSLDTPGTAELTKQYPSVVDAVIVGGGIHGCSLAMNLSALGVSCAVIEKEYVARHASGVNGGGVRTLGRAIPEVALSLESNRIWQRIDDLLQADCGLTISGQVRIAESEEDLAKIQSRVDALHKLGFYHEKVIGREVLRELVPSCAEHCVGALYVEHDGFANPFRVTSAFRSRASALGARFFEGTEVIDVRRATGVWNVVTTKGNLAAKFLFNCAGAWSGSLARRMGDELPITADGSMQIVTARLPHFLTPVVGSASRSVSIKQWPNGTVTIGGGHRSPVDLETGKSTITPTKLALGAAAAIAVIPQLRECRAVRFWSGIEAFTPDKLPIIDRGSQEGAFHVTGFSAHGFQLAPVVGRLVAEMAVSGKSPELIQPFSRSRFSIE